MIVRFVARHFLLAAALFLVMLPSWAAEEKADAAAQKPMSFLVNVGRSPETMRFLQAGVVLEYATDQAAAHFTACRPRLMHHIILLLSDTEASTLLSIKGKQDLQERIASALNALFGATPKTGIRDVFFTDFIVQ